MIEPPVERIALFTDFGPGIYAGQMRAVLHARVPEVPVIDLVQETGHPCTIRRGAVGQVGGKDLSGVRVDRQVEFPPNPSFGRLSKVADVNSQPRAVDEQVDRLIVHGCTKWHLAEALEASGKCRVIGDGKLYV